MKRRLILYRAKAKESNEWIYGDVIDHPTKRTRIRHFVNTQYTGARFVEDPVLPDTVSEYTGKEDKKGKRIFEGDVLRFHYSFPDETGTLLSGDEDYVVAWSKEQAGWYLYSSSYDEEDGLSGTDTLFEVVGNVYDNPDMLKGRQKFLAFKTI